MKKIIYLMLIGVLCIASDSHAGTAEQNVQSNLEKAFAKQTLQQAVSSISTLEIENLVTAIKERLETYTQKALSTEQVINGLYQRNPTDLAEEAAYEFRWRKEVSGAAKINENMDVKAFEDYLGYLHHCVYDCVFGNVLWKEKEIYTDLSFANVFKQSLSVKYGEMFKEDFTREVSNLYENMQWLVTCSEDEFKAYWENIVELK